MATRWSRIEPASAGFSNDMVEGLDASELGGNPPNIHAVMVSRRGALVLERYFAGEDQQIGRGNLGTIAFAGDTLHDLRSITKALSACSTV